MIPSWSSFAIGLFGPLAIASLAKLRDLPERTKVTAVHFVTGALLAFVALITERYLFTIFGPSIPGRYHVLVEAILFNSVGINTAKPDSVPLPRLAPVRTHNYH